MLAMYRRDVASLTRFSSIDRRRYETAARPFENSPITLQTSASENTRSGNGVGGGARRRR